MSPSLRTMSKSSISASTTMAITILTILFFHIILNSLID